MRPRALDRPAPPPDLTPDPLGGGRRTDRAVPTVRGGDEPLNVLRNGEQETCADENPGVVWRIRDVIRAALADTDSTDARLTAARHDEEIGPGGVRARPEVDPPDGAPA